MVAAIQRQVQGVRSGAMSEDVPLPEEGAQYRDSTDAGPFPKR